MGVHVAINQSIRLGNRYSPVRHTSFSLPMKISRDIMVLIEAFGLPSVSEYR